MPLLPRLEITVIAVVRAGMLTPAASVSVAKTALMRLSWKRLSTSPFSSGSMPAWWAATPRESHSRRSSSSGRSGLARRKASTRAATSAPSKALRRPSLSDADCSAAWSHPAREKMKTIAGSIRLRWRARTRKGIDATCPRARLRSFGSPRPPYRPPRPPPHAPPPCLPPRPPPRPPPRAAATRSRRRRARRRPPPRRRRARRRARRRRHRRRPPPRARAAGPSGVTSGCSFQWRWRFLSSWGRRRRRRGRRSCAQRED